MITVAGSGRELELCLLEPAGGILGCANTPPDPNAEQAEGEDAPRVAPPGVAEAGAGEEAEPLDDDDFAAMSVEVFHGRAFAMPLGLSNIDLGSLDGTATISEEANRERMPDLLDKVKSESKP